jgi:2-(1,2-epoxy-1,2-dihydrophenyl)acetyl-CoA isomerase
MTAVLLEQKDGIATVTLNRPDQLNAMNDELLDALVETLENLYDNADVRVIVLRGAGKAFCVGGDLTATHDRSRPTRGESRLRHHVRAAELLSEGHAVTIAAIHGACAGAGFSLVAACDLRLVAQSAVFRSAFLTAGMSGDFGLAWSLTQLVGGAKAREILFCNEKFDGQRAAELGLASRCVPADQLDAEVTGLAAALAAVPPLAVRGMKANLVDATVLGFPEALLRESARHVQTAFSEDAAEAGRAFLEKRTPTFRGR